MRSKWLFFSIARRLVGVLESLFKAAECSLSRARSGAVVDLAQGEVHGRELANDLVVTVQPVAELHHGSHHVTVAPLLVLERPLGGGELGGGQVEEADCIVYLPYEVPIEGGTGPERAGQASAAGLQPKGDER